MRPSAFLHFVEVTLEIATNGEAKLIIIQHPVVFLVRKSCVEKTATNA